MGTTTPRPLARVPDFRLRCDYHFSVLPLLLAWLILSAPSARAATFTLGAATLLEGAGAGTDTVTLAVSGSNSWTASANAAWLHLAPGSLSGTGSTNITLTLDANPGPMRGSTFTIAGQILAVSQAGTNYVAVTSPVGTLAASSLNQPFGVAADGSGNVYFSDYGNNAIKRLILGNPSSFITGLNGPLGLALDKAGNIYFADSRANAIKKWTAGSASTSVLIPGLSGPVGVALDAAGNVYFTQTNVPALIKWSVANSNLTTLANAASGLSLPHGIAVDVGGNVYVADYGNNTIKKWNTASSNLTTVLSGLPKPTGVVVDGHGNLFMSLSQGNLVAELSAVNGSSNTVAGGLNHPGGVALDPAGNVYFTDSGNNAVKEIQYVFMNTNPVFEPSSLGYDTLPQVLPASVRFTGPFTPTTNASWLLITSVGNGLVTFFYGSTPTARTGAINILGQAISISQPAGTFSLGATQLYEAPGTGTDTVVVASSSEQSIWNASANAPWLHITLANQVGGGVENEPFSFDANPGPTRTGTLTVAGMTVTVTQAGTNYVRAGLMPAVPYGLFNGYTFAVNPVDNSVYFADGQSQAIERWSAKDNTVVTLVSSGLSSSFQIAVDTSSNIYISDYNNAVIKKWSPVTQTMTTLISSNIVRPVGIAVDKAGNVYYADNGNSTIWMWSPVNNTAVSLVASGIANPQGVAVDAAGNVYFADTSNNQVKEWSSVNLGISTLMSGLNFPTGVAVDGSGNVFACDNHNNLVKKWSAASNTVSVVTSALVSPSSVAFNNLGDLYLADNNSDGLKVIPYALLNSAPKFENGDMGDDIILPAVVPATENLAVPFNPTVDQPWLTVSATNNGLVAFTYGSGIPGTRSGNINLLGVNVPVIQTSTTNLSMTSLVVGSAAGTNSVTLAVTPENGAWTAVTNNPWLHLTPANRAGAASANIVFSYDANTNGTRTGTLTIDGQLFTVIQAGSTYAPTTNWMTLQPVAYNITDLKLAPDGSGTFFAANYSSDILHGGLFAGGIALTNLPISGISHAIVVAPDAAGNIFFTDVGNQTIEMWNVTNGLTTALVSGIGDPTGFPWLALDPEDNVYFHNQPPLSGPPTIDEWRANTATVKVLVTATNGESTPEGIAADCAGNVYYADNAQNIVQRWTLASQTTTNLISGLNAPMAIGVDVSGNIYVADQKQPGQPEIRKWSAADGTTVLLPAAGSTEYNSVEVDTNEDLFTTGNAINEFPRAFVNVGTNFVSSAVGVTNLPVVLPANTLLQGPLQPVSDQPWLTVWGTTNGIVTYSCSANLSPARTAHISILGQPVTVVQGGPTFTPALPMLVEGPNAGTDSVTLAVSPETGTWTAAANASWLHLAPGYQAGTGSTNIIFSFDANPGVTRGGTFTLGGTPFTVTQAPFPYVPTTSPLMLLSNQYSSVTFTITLDSAGNIYYFDIEQNVLNKLNPATGGVTPLLTTNSGQIMGLALDPAGNFYLADSMHNTIKKWIPATGNLITLISNNIASPVGVAVDNAGNIYFCDNSTLQKWSVIDGSQTFLYGGGGNLAGMARDAAGNFYISDASSKLIRKWTAANGSLSTVVSVPNTPGGIAVDGGGNVYITEANNNLIQKWSPAGNTLTTIVTNVTQPGCLVADAAENLYLGALNGAQLIDLQPRAFLDNTPQLVGLGGATNSLPVVLPATEILSGPFVPTTDQPGWLSLIGVTNDIVSYTVPSFAVSNRMASIFLLGQTITVTQKLIVVPPLLGGFKVTTNHTFQFSFTNNQTTNFSVHTTTNLALPLTNWPVLGGLSNISPGVFQFTSPGLTNAPQRYFRVSSP